MAILSYDEYKKKNKKQIEERNKREYEKRAVNVSEKKNTKNDIAPIKTTNKNDRTWFNTGAFSDGYQLGDISKTILGTLKDVKQDVSKGVLRIGEGVVDTGAYLVGGASKLLGNDNFADKTKKFIARDLVEESKAANLLANANNQTDILFDLGKQGYKAIKNKDIKELTNFNDSFEKDSLLGDKSDSLVQSGGQLAGTVGLQTLGVPWWLTTGVTSFGGETQQAFNQKATYGEAGFSGLVSAGAEILTEKISGGIKFGGRTLDEGLQRLISEKITNKVLQNATKLGVDMVGEGSEEVLSEIISNVGRKLSYEDEKTWEEMLLSEEAMDSYLEAFIGGAVLGGAGSVGQSIMASKQQAVQQAEQELGRQLTTEERTKIEEAVEKQQENASNQNIKEEIAPIKEQDALPNSKVRDKDGKLLKVYHGTRADFDAFDTSKAGQNYQNNWSNNGKGIYFTDDKAEALEFAKSSIDNGDPKVKEAYLDITNPFDSSKDYTNELSDMANEYGIEPYYLERGDRLFNWFNSNNKDIVEALKKYGYDGVVDHGHYTAFDSNQIKSVENAQKIENNVQNAQENNNKTENNVLMERILDSQESIEDTSKQVTSQKIKSSMTMEEAKQMVERAFNTQKDFVDYKTADEWLKADPEEVSMIIENTESLIRKYINSNQDILNEEYGISDVLEAYIEGSLIGKAQTPTQRLDLSKDTNYKDDRFYAPQNIKGGKDLYNIANQRVTKNNSQEVYRARGNFIINAHNKGYIESLGLTQEEVNKKLKSWANYTQKAIQLSNEVNEGVATQNKWTGIENSSIVNTLGISEQELNSMVKEIKGQSSEWQRKYITSTMLALDTHIDYSPLTFVFEGKTNNSYLGLYNGPEKTIYISSDYKAGQNTVAHEIGHYIDEIWGKDLFGYTLGLTSLGRSSDLTKLSKEQRQFVENFNNFIIDIESTSDIRSNYTMTPTEVFARFVGKFTEWTKNQATNNRYGYEDKYYKDNFTEKQYKEFVKILQEKALLDTTGQTSKVDIAPVKGESIVQMDQSPQETDIDEDILPENNEQKTITKEWTDKVNEQNEVNEPLAKEQAKTTGHNTMIGYSPILSNYKLYSKGSLSWVTPDGKLNSKVIAETEIDTFLSKNKIDRLVGGINTFENGLTNQLSNQNDIAPIKQELAVLTNEIKTTIKETKKELKSLTSEINEVKASVNEVIEENKVLTETDIPIVEAQASENLNALTDNDIAPIQEDTTPEYESNSTTIESPFDTRDIDEVGNRKVKAYQYENPEVRPYFEMEAKIMLREIEDTVKGARMPIYDEVGNMEYVGVTRETTDAIAYLKDNYNYTYAEIEKGLNAIIEDNGKENIAVAKRIEFMLDDRLRNGYTAIDGMQIPPNQEYIDFLHEKGITEYNQETSLGLTDEHAPAEQFTEEEIIEKNKKIQEASIENATENHPPLTDEFIEELNKQSIEWAKESGKLKESKPVESASNTQQVEEIAPVKEQKPTLKEVTNQDDPVMKAVKDKARKQLEKTIGERRNELISNDKYANNNIVIKKKQSLKESATKTWDAFQSHFINRNRQIDKLSKATKNDEIKFKGDRVNNIAGEIGGDIFTAQTDNYGNVIGKSLDSPFEAARQEGIDTYFDNYLKHQSNIERHAQGKGSSKISAETSKKYVKAYESKYPQLKELAKDVYTYNQNLLDNAVQNGLIDEKFKNVLTTMYGKYVPFYEQNTEPSTYMTPDEIKASRPIKKAKGGTDSNLLGIEQAMIQQTYAYKNAIAKNDLYKEIGSVMGKKVELGADLRTSPTQLNDTLYADENGKYLTYYENGQQKTVQITDELYTELSRDLENQIRNLEEKYSLIAKPLQKISQLRGQILTTYNIGFVATNPFKDIQDALLNTKNFKGYLKNVLTQSTINDSTKGKNVNKYAEDFKALTGKDITSIRDAKTLKRKARSIYKDYQAGTMWNRFITSYGTNATSMEFGEAGVDVKAKNKGFLRGIERANNYMEVMFRYPEFKATLERGGSFTEALYNAREVTTNFGRGGTISKAINRNGATFFNTSVQGMDKFIRNFSGENGARGFIGAVSKATAVGLLPAILNHLLFDDDDEYEALPDYIKDNYYLFKTGYGEFIRIPKGRMISVLGSSARRSLELASGEEDAFEGFLKNASDQVGASNPLKENIFSPLIQAYGSENGEAWYGDDLVPTRLQNKPKAEQFDEGTDEFSKWLGKQLNISPYKINYVIDQYSGGFGDLILPMITDEAKSDGTLLAPLKDKFTTNSTDDNKYVGELYDLSEELTIKANGESATEEDILKNKYLNSIKSQMSELYKEKREIQSSGMSKEAKYAQAKVIQNMINALAKEGLDFHTVIETTDNYASVGYYEEYYKTSEGEWYSINDKELEAINSMGMTTEEKNSYFGAKTNIYEIKDEYEDLLSEASEEEKDILYTEQKRAIIDEVRNTNLTDEEKAYLYDRYYGSADKLNVITETNIPLDAYLDIEYQDFKADKDRYGKSVSGSKKKKIMNYIESSGLDYNQKIILHKVYYPADDSYNYEIADYVFNNVETYEQRINILETLGFKIGEDGIVRWE